MPIELRPARFVVLRLPFAAHPDTRVSVIRSRWIAHGVFRNTRVPDWHSLAFHGDGPCRRPWRQSCSGFASAAAAAFATTSVQKSTAALS
jgi:hypothetical protein